MPIRIPIRFIKLLYFISRDRTKRGKVAVCRGGKVSEEDWTVAMKQMEELKLNN